MRLVRNIQGYDKCRFAIFFGEGNTHGFSKLILEIFMHIITNVIFQKNLS